MKDTSMIEYENLKNLNKPFFEEYKREFARVLDSGWYILGEEVAAFEREFAAYCGSGHAVGLANGLEALYIALEALEIPPGSEVIVPSNTYIATILAVVQAGLVPVPVEPDIATYNIDPEKIRPRITERTKAVMAVHLYGKACDMDPIVDLCKEYGLYLVEDCAQAHGTRYRGKTVGTFGDFGAWSFYPTKNLGCLGDGGALTTDNPRLAEKARVLRNYGSRVKYRNEVIGLNSRLDEVQAAFLRVKLRHLDAINEHKRNLAEVYFSNLGPKYVLPAVNDDYYDIYHIFNIRHKNRDGLRSWLLEYGVKTEIHYPISPNKQEAMKGILEEACPVSEEIHATTLSLPVSFSHSEDDILEVCKLLNAWEGA